MKYNKLSIIGIVVFLSVLVFFYGIKFLQDESFQKSNFSFNVVFNDLQGLDISDDVRMLGKRIGRVTGTKIIGEKIAVELTIDNNFAFKIPIDSKIEITQTDIMGSKFISIYPGKDIDKFILDNETIAGKNAEVASLTKDIGDVASCHVGYRSCFYREVPLGPIDNGRKIEMKFLEKEKKFDPEKVYKGQPNPTKL